jgi:SAM-dependent methyltransferase
MSIWEIEPERQAELMDDPALPEAEHLAALNALATINAVSLTPRQLAAAVAAIVPGPLPAGRPLEVVDLACGGGDITLALADRLARRLAGHGDRGSSPVVHVLGIDSSPRAIERARTLAGRRGLNRQASVDFAVRDVLLEGCPPCDVAVSSLFLHHLDDAPATEVLRSMAAAARLGGVVSDLVRSRAGLVLAVLGTTLLARSRVARVDGPLSVRAARTPAEYRELAARAGLPQAVVRRCWPERVLLSWQSAELVSDLVPSVACA